MRTISYNTADTLRASLLPFGTLLPLVATSYMVKALKKISPLANFVVLESGNFQDRILNELLIPGSPSPY
jgi:hypothetical protein